MGMVSPESIIEMVLAKMRQADPNADRAAAMALIQQVAAGEASGPAPGLEASMPPAVQSMQQGMMDPMRQMTPGMPPHDPLFSELGESGVL